MELIIHILLIFIALNFLVKLSFWKPIPTIIAGILCGAFIIFVYPYSIEQSKTQIADFLNNTTMMQDASVLVTMEAAIGFGFCFVAMKKLFGDRAKYYNLLKWFPGLLILPVLFYALTQVMFSFSGVNFARLAYTCAAVTAVGIPLLSYGLKKLIPEEDLRLEIHFLVCLFTAIIGLIATVNGKTTYSAENAIDIKALLFSTLIFIVGLLVGWLWYNLRWKIKNRIEEKKQTE